MVNLWPNQIVHQGMKAPVTILKEQAYLLGQMTKNIVEAHVSFNNANQVATESLPFHYLFFIVAPALQNYRYKLFSIEYDIDIYPIIFHLSDDIKKDIPEEFVNEKGEVKAQSEDEFQSILAEIFKGQKTLRVINAMLAQSEGFDPFAGQRYSLMPADAGA